MAANLQEPSASSRSSVQHDLSDHGANQVDPSNEHDEAAKVIQRVYRGHRQRRHLQGLKISADSRWTEAVHEARYRQRIRPKSLSCEKNIASGDGDAETKDGMQKDQSEREPGHEGSAKTERNSSARSAWLRAGTIARRVVEDSPADIAGSGENRNTLPLSNRPSECQLTSQESKGPISNNSTFKENAQHDSTSHLSQTRVSSLGTASSQSQPTTSHTNNDLVFKSQPRTLDLRYFLELIDSQHRYGSNLCKYHAAWLQRPTKMNFFTWLDESGEAQSLDLPKCSRERLDAMRVRYLSREERWLYQVVIDADGRLVWRKNGERVDTSPKWRDSVQGIVRADDPSAPPQWASGYTMGWSSESGSSICGDVDDESQCEGIENHPPVMASQDMCENEKEPKTQLSEGNRTARQTIQSKVQDFAKRRPRDDDERKRKKQKWIFVADTKNNLYIGIKQSGAFQHSSFLHGSRIFVAGLIRVKDGQLRRHYRTPSSNLREFLRNLERQGVDMSVGAVGESYAAMIGTDGFMKTRDTWRKVKSGIKDITLS